MSNTTILELIKRIRKSIRNFLILPFALYSVRIFLYQSTGKSHKALLVATKYLHRKPLNWPLTKYLIEESFLSEDAAFSKEFLSTYLTHFCHELRFNDETCYRAQYKNFSRAIIEALALSSFDPLDYCRIDFLGDPDTLNLSLHIVSVGRFSNFIIQLSNAIAIARAVGVTDIFISRSDSLLNLFPKLSSFTCDYSNISIHFDEPKTGFVISGYFFHACRQDSLLYASQSLRETVSIFRHATRFPQYNVETEESLTPLRKNLVIHVRSGDIFKSRNVQRDYGQPPLSYYIIAIKHYDPSYVTLVFEDQGNPVIRPLILFLQNSGITFHVQSSDLVSDLRIMSNAEALVISRGTFAYGILCINDYLHTLYCFNSSQEEDPLMRLHLSAVFYGSDQSVSAPRIFEVIDEGGAFSNAICRNNWKNTSCQRDLMISYPESFLKVISKCLSM